MSSSNQLNINPNSQNQSQTQQGMSHQQQSYINFTNPNMFQDNANLNSNLQQQGISSGNYHQIHQNSNLQIPDLINFKPQAQHSAQALRNFPNQQGGQIAGQNLPTGSFNFNFFNFQHKPPIPPPLPQQNPTNNHQNRFNPNQKRPYNDYNNNHRNNMSQGNNNFNNSQQLNNKQGGNNKHCFNPNQLNKQKGNNQGNSNQNQGNSYQNQVNNGVNKNNQNFNNKKKQQQNNFNQNQEEKQQQFINNQEGENISQQKQQQGRNSLQQKHPHQINDRKGQFQQGRNHQNLQKDQKQNQMNQQIFQQDNQEEIRRWIESRKRNYPNSENIQRKKDVQNENEQTGHVSQFELSKLEIKLRKKIQISSSSIKKLEVQQKHYDMLRKLYTEGDKAPKQRRMNNDTQNRYSQQQNKYDNEKKKQQKDDQKIQNQIQRVEYTDLELKKNLKTQNKLKKKLDQKRITYFQILENIKNRKAIYDNVQQTIDEKKKEESQNQNKQSESYHNQDEKEKIFKEDNENDEMPIEIQLVSLKENNADTTEIIQQQLENVKKNEIIHQSKNQNKKNKKKQMNQENLERLFEDDQHNGCENMGCEKDKIKDMITELKEKRDKYSSELDLVFNYKANSSNFRYKTNTLLTNLVLDEIYKERNYLLQAIRFMVTNNFFDEEQTVQSEKSQPKIEIEQEKPKEVQDEQIQEEKPKQNLND